MKYITIAIILVFVFISGCANYKYEWVEKNRIAQVQIDCYEAEQMNYKDTLSYFCVKVRDYK